MSENRVYYVTLSWGTNPTGYAIITLLATSVIDAISQVAKYDIRDCNGKKIDIKNISMDEVALIATLTPIDEPVPSYPHGEY